MRRKFHKSKIKKRTFPKNCYVCGKEVAPDIKLKKILGKDGKIAVKTITIQPLMIGKDKDGKPLYRHQDGKCEPGTAYYLKKVQNIEPELKRLFENGIEQNEKKKFIPNIDANIEDADWPKHKKLRRRK